MAFSESGFERERMEGSTSPPSDSSQIPRKTTRACSDRCTSCGRRIFMRSAGMRQTDFGKTISERRMCRTSPGRVIVKATSCKAARSVGQPSYSSIERISAPSCRSSVMAARCCTIGRRSAPRSANVGSLVARRVTTARRNTLPIVPRRRLAVSRRPVFSMRCNSTNISAGVIAVIGRSARGLARSSSNQRFLLTVISAAPFAFRLARYSSATAPKLCRRSADLVVASFLAREHGQAQSH